MQVKKWNRTSAKKKGTAVMGRGGGFYTQKRLILRAPGGRRDVELLKERGGEGLTVTKRRASSTREKALSPARGGSAVGSPWGLKRPIYARGGEPFAQKKGKALTKKEKTVKELGGEGRSPQVSWAEKKNCLVTGKRRILAGRSALHKRGMEEEKI